MQAYELNIDGLVGPTHHYAGLAFGNIASVSNAYRSANPQAAALQGLKKMRFLHELGLKQAVFPPHQRPNLMLLAQLGFTGSLQEQLKQAANYSELLSASYSASAMWAANAATVSSSLDCQDHRVHFTAANLISNLHRHQEADFSKQLLERIFANERYFQHHPILPRSLSMSDEGAANHSRLASHHQPGVSLFVYGKQTLATGVGQSLPHHFPARQTLEASMAIARSHCLYPDKVVFAQQNPDVIDKGVFHNDVIAVANESVMLCHEEAFMHQAEVLKELQTKSKSSLQLIEIKKEALSVNEAVATYLFNSQLLTIKPGNMILLAPTECETSLSVQQLLEKLINDDSNPISGVYYMDLKQSMQNGGGPACLRLRVLLTEEELKAMHQGVLIDEPLLDKLEAWVKKHYRSSLQAKDLLDPALISESYTALDELTQLLKLKSLYPFQCE